MAGVFEPEVPPQDDRRSLQALLDQELSRLADIYRLPILLCDLEGKSIKATAQQLGWSYTVAGQACQPKVAGQTLSSPAQR